MTQRVNFSILFCTISILTAQAQWNKQDSIRLQELLNGDGELKINTEAVKSIHFDFQSDKDNIKGTPIMSEDKPWMKFLKDLPKNFGDTTKWVRPNFVRLTPYTPYTTWHEDPVNDPIFLKRKDSLTISWKLNIKLIPGLQNGYVILPAGRINRSRMAGDPPDIFLTPRLAHVGLLEFYKAEEVINEGKACVSRALPALETLLHRDFGHAHQGD